MYPYPSIVRIQLDQKKKCLPFYSMLLKNQVSIYFMESIFGDAYLSVEMNICEKSMTQPLLWIIPKNTKIGQLVWSSWYIRSQPFIQIGKCIYYSITELLNMFHVDKIFKLKKRKLDDFYEKGHEYELNILESPFSFKLKFCEIGSNFLQ